MAVLLTLIGTDIALCRDGADEADHVDRAEPLPQELAGVGIEARLDAKLPLDATFTDTRGKQVTIGDYFDGERPVILVPVYYGCPMLCGLTLNAMLDTLKQMDWTVGEEFRVLTVSFDPRETHKLAKAKQQNLLKDYGRAGAEQGFDMLVGKEDQIRSVMDAIGFTYKWIAKRQEYAHTAALIVCTPDGRVSQYMYGVQYEPKTARLLLIDAADGAIGSMLDQIILYCYHYNASDGTYAPMAMNIMRAGGVLILIVMAVTLLPVWYRAMRHKSHAGDSRSPAGESLQAAAGTQGEQVN
jgi:protein SCO1/2